MKAHLGGLKWVIESQFDSSYLVYFDLNETKLQIKY